MKTWFITGCSSGIGKSLAEAVLEKGWNAVVTARDAQKVAYFVEKYPQTALAVSLDVTKEEQIVEAIKAAQQKFGHIDVLVNNAGYGYRAAVEEGDAADVAQLFDTNFFGPIELIKEVLPEMRERKSGAIINVSSIAAQRTAPGSGYYAATKAALESLTDGLRKEVGPLHIKVMIVEPGAFRTDFSGRSLKQSEEVIADYAETAGKRRMEHDKTHGTQPGDPERGARLIIEALESADSPFRLLLGSDAVQVVGDEWRERLALLEKHAEFSKRSDFTAEA